VECFCRLSLIISNAPEKRGGTRASLITSRCRQHPHRVISECQKCSHPFAHRFEPLAIRLADVFWIFSRGVPLICQWHFNCLTLSVRAIKKLEAACWSKLFLGSVRPFSRQPKSDVLGANCQGIGFMLLKQWPTNMRSVLHYRVVGPITRHIWIQ
jgi:hypothetical protein